jgi:dihydroorotase
MTGPGGRRDPQRPSPGKTAVASRYAMILRGGEVIDPSQQLRGRRDVAVADGKIAALAESIPDDTADFSVDVTGKLVVPGLVDLHTHFYHNVSRLGADPDPTFFPTGVTTAVDAGSSGWRTWPGLRDLVMARSRTRLYAFLNVAGLGMLAPELPDPEEPAEVQARETLRCLSEDPERLVGIKVRVMAPGGTGAANALPALRKARDAADATGRRVMVHVYATPIPWGRILEHLRAGDIVTHAFNGTAHNLLDDRGAVRPEVFEARARGVLFDAGYARPAFDAEVTRAALDQGFPPDTLGSDCISPDQAFAGRYPMLMGTMSIFLAMGMPLERMIEAATVAPARAIGREATCGSLAVGREADITVLELEDRPTAFTDCAGRQVQARRQLRPVMTFRGGARVA